MDITLPNHTQNFEINLFTLEYGDRKTFIIFNKLKQKIVSKKPSTGEDGIAGGERF